AVLILRDVLGWHAAEVAGMLDISTIAVNSALQRARESLRSVAPAQDEISEPADPELRAVVDKYAAAFENADVPALTRLLREDATFERPPMPTWFAGREQIGRFLAAQVLRQPGDFRMIPVAANGQPAFAVYMRESDGVHRAHGIQVLTVSGSSLIHVISFNEADLLATFGMPPAFPSG